MRAFLRISSVLFTSISLGALAASDSSLAGDGVGGEASAVVRREVRGMNSQEALAAIKGNLRIHTIASIASRSRELSIEDLICNLQRRFSNMDSRNVLNAVLFEKSQKIATVYSRQPARKLREEFRYVLSLYEEALDASTIQNLQTGLRGEMVKALGRVYKGPKAIQDHQQGDVDPEEWYREVSSRSTTATPKASSKKEKRPPLTSATMTRKLMLPSKGSKLSEWARKMQEPRRAWR